MILVVDDDLEVARSHAQMVGRFGYQAAIECDPRRARERVANGEGIDLVLLDVKMPRMNGLEVLREIKLARPEVGVVMATVLNEIETAIRATKAGAFNYLLKPLQAERVQTVLATYFETRPRSLVDDPRFGAFITGHPPFQEIFRRLAAFAAADVPILILGESGTGKEILSRLVHSLSSRRDEPFLPVNVAALSGTLFGSELFGHRQGAFTGADREHRGYLEAAGRGTLFLDEIGEIGEEQQKMLLRVVEGGRFQRVGDPLERPFSGRLVLATNRDLASEVAAGGFRSDLYYRLASYAVQIPPLRERPGDVRYLAEYFVKKHASQHGRNIQGIADEVHRLLSEYPFPGNVRELEGVIGAAVLLETGPLLRLSSLPRHLVEDVDRERGGETLEAHKARAVARALAASGGNQSKAAERLGVSRTCFIRMLKKYREEGLVD